MVVDHFLVENRGQARGHRRRDPNPIGWTAAPDPVLLLEVSDKLISLSKT